MSQRTYAIIAAYNEEKHIAAVVKETKKYCKNIVVVDDGSKDNTGKQAQEEHVTVLRHIINLGKGAAVKTGCDYALAQGAKIFVLVDADGQHEPKEIPHFLESLEGKDIVFGYRRMRKNMPFILKFGNKCIGLVTRFLYKMDLHDTQCGYRALTAKAYRKVRWRSADYSMESEIVANVGKHHLAYAEIPIATIYSDRYKGTTILDGIKIVLNMIFWRLTR